MSVRKGARRSVDVRAVVVGMLAALAVVVCVVVIVVNQQTVGWWNLFAMLGAVAGLIALLALYNRRFR